MEREIRAKNMTKQAEEGKAGWERAGCEDAEIYRERKKKQGRTRKQRKLIRSSEREKDENMEQEEKRNRRNKRKGIMKKNKNLPRTRKF